MAVPDELFAHLEAAEFGLVICAASAPFGRRGHILDP